MAHPSLTIFDNRIHDSINTDFEIEALDDRCLFSEGPVWDEQGYYLFSDTSSNIICRIEPGQAKEVFLQKSGISNEAEAELPRMMGSNGLTFTKEHELLICQHGNHGIARWDGEQLHPFIKTYNGKPLNSPNDIIAHPNGAVFFSDPPYGLKDQKLNPEKYQPLAGMYCWRDGTLTLITDRYQYPNGVCLSPGFKYLYTCSNKPFEKFVLEFDAETLQLKRQVCAENSDGIKCDRRGNLYLCTNDGLVIVNNNGARLAKINLPTIPANCCWGGGGKNDLFITARNYIFLLRNLQKA